MDLPPLTTRVRHPRIITSTLLTLSHQTNMSNEKQTRGDIAYVIFDMDGLLSESQLRLANGSVSAPSGLCVLWSD